jgi:hypothetical protein
MPEGLAIWFPWGTDTIIIDKIINKIINKIYNNINININIIYVYIIMNPSVLTVYKSPFPKFRLGKDFDGGYIIAEIPNANYKIFLAGGRYRK